MPNEDKIVEQVGNILNPTISTEIEHYSVFDDIKKYENILLKLCVAAKESYWASNLKPYIQIKDDKGNYLYNDVLNITKVGVEFPVTESNADFYLDFILDSSKPDNVYAVIGYYHTERKEMDRTFYSFAPNKEKDAPVTLKLSDCHSIAEQLIKHTIQLRNSSKPINKDGSISMNLLVHKYNPSKNTWTFQLPNTL